MRASLLALTLLLLAAPYARADVCNWTSGTPGNWTGGGNWSCGHAPGPGDSALIQNGQTVTLNVDVSVSQFILAVGSSLTGSGTLTVTGSMSWSSGSMQGTGTTLVAAGATLSISGAGDRSLSGQRQLVNEGTATWSGTGAFANGSSGDAFVNRGDLTITATRAAPETLFFAGSFVNEAGATLTIAPAQEVSFSSAFANAGAISIDAGLLRLTGFNGPGGTDSGTYTLAAGTALVFADARTVQASGGVSGPGTVRVESQTTAFAGTLDVDVLTITSGTLALNADASVPTFSLANGTLAGSGTLTVTEDMTWTNGSMQGTGTTLVAAGATLSISGPNDRSLSGQRQLVNEGTATWSGTGAFANGSSGDAFVNRGDLTITATRAAPETLFFAGSFVNEAGATLTIAPAQEVSFSSAFANAGAVEVDAGKLALRGFNGPGGTDAGTYTIAAGAVLEFGDTRTVTAAGIVTGDGTLRVTTTVQTVFNGTLDVPTLDIGTASNPTFVLNADATVETFGLAGGTLTGSGDLTVTGAMTWTTAGAMRGTGTTLVAPGATLSISGTGTGSLTDQRQLVNEGTATWTGTFVFSNDNAGSAIVNRGTFALDVVRPADQPVYFGGRFVNEAGGTVTRTAAGDASFSALFDNAGTVALGAGALRLSGFNGPSGTTTGTFTVASGAQLAFVNSGHTLSPGSVIAGTGTVTQQTAQLVHGATVRPGASPGTLTWAPTSGASYAPAASAVLDVEIGGALPGTGHDQLAVTGDATLGGTLRVRMAGGFLPAVGDRFAVVTCTGTCAGPFAALDLPAGLSGEVQVSAQVAEFVVTAVVLPAAAFVVTTTADDVDASPGDGACETALGACSLRAAVQETNALPTADTVTVPAGTYTLTRAGRLEDLAATGDLDVTGALTLTGAGADATVLDGATLDRLFHVHGATVAISGLAMRNGEPSLPCSSSGNGTDGGGALWAQGGAVTVEGVLVESSRTCQDGGGFMATSSSGLQTSLAVTNSAVVGTSSNAGAIGALGVGSGTVALTLTNVTVSGHTGGAALYTASNGGAITAALTNVTLAGNTGGISVGGIVGAISVPLRNTLLANAGTECLGPVQSLGHNLADDASCAAAFTQPGDLNGAVANLLPLAGNGGPTPTHALACGSAALDAGTATGAPATDQRGLPRGTDGDGDGTGATDIGAFEAAAAPGHLVAVTTTADSGPGSLRQAMDLADANANHSTVCFGIPGPGPHTIQPASDLPRIETTVTIDGYTQPGASPNTVAAGSSDAVLRVEIDGQNARGTGFLAAVDNVTIRGLAIGGFVNAGIAVENGFFAVSGARIEGNFIGTDATGTAARPNGSSLPYAVLLGTGGGHVVGGAEPAARNVISGNARVGVGMTATGSTSAVSTGNQIVGNLIGTQPDGVTPLGNGEIGVQIGACGGLGNLVQGNVVAFNGSAFPTSAGIQVDSFPGSCAETLNNRILGNAVFGNAGAGIDLKGSVGPTPNDPGDADTGANRLQNTPEVLAADLPGGGDLRVTYRVDSDAAHAAYPLRVEFFRADDGEGAAFLGFDTYAAADHDGCGTPPCAKTVTFTPAAPVAAGDALVATATDAAGNTSEFTGAPGVVAGAALTLTGAEGWRMLAPAYADQAYDDLLGPLWTQGFPGADAPDGTPNAYTYDEAVVTDANGDGTADRDDGYAPLAQQAEGAPAGRGVFAYVYADDDANTPGPQGGFPKVIPQSGAPYAGPFPAPFAVSFTPSGSPADDGWVLLGNPFDAGMDWDAAGWTRTNVSSAIYVWDPNADGGPQYLTWSTGIGGSLPGSVVAPNQGFWAKATGASPALAAPAAARVAGGVFHGRTARGAGDSTTVVALRLDGVVGSAARAATAHVAFLDGAAPGLDAHDAYELAPLVTPTLLLYTAPDAGPTAGLDIDARPLPTGPVEVALGVQARAEGPSVPAALTLSWPALRALPADWIARLEDRQTGTTVDLRQSPSYTFETTTEPAAISGPDAPTGASALRGGGAARFVLVLGPAATAAGGPPAAPAVLALHPPRPNPAARAATVRVDLPAPAHATLAVYDLLGREVAVLLRGERPAGRHDVALDAGALAPGVYVLRLTTDAGALTRRLVVAR